MHMASEAIQCEFGIIVGKLLLALEVAKCRHRSAHGARRQEPPNFRRFLFWGEGEKEDIFCCGVYVLVFLRKCGIMGLVNVWSGVWLSKSKS